MQPKRPPGDTQTLVRAVVLAAATCCAVTGCTPTHYRLRADAETYGILAEKTEHPQWQTPPFAVEPTPESRNFDPFDPDHPPIPPDDPAAHLYMHCADGRRGHAHWHKRGDAAQVANWIGQLELTDDGKLELAPDRAVELGIVNSREYQFELEHLYLTALDLSLERFEFQLQWFGTNRTFHEFLGNQISGRPADLESNTLTTNSNLGFGRALTTGGQLLVDFANTFVWEFTGPNSGTTFSTISVGLIQPLLRGAFKDVRMQALTQSERNVLYAARDYARFRKRFYLDTVAGDGGYLSLLLQLQSIRNLESNLESLELSRRTHEALARAGVVTQLQVDQVFQSYQSGRLRLIRARNNLATSQDRFKIALGLPPELEVVLNDSLLDPFELNSPEITRLQRDNDDLLASFRELDEAPTASELVAGFDQLQEMLEWVEQERVQIVAQWQQWQQLDAVSEAVTEEYEQLEDETRLGLKTRLAELERDLVELQTVLKKEAAGIVDSDLAWETIQRLARRQSTLIGDLFVVQSQVRAYLIQLEPPEFEEDNAIEYGLANRLDLMNRLAEVVDAWRNMHVAANALKADLDVSADAILGTVPGGNNPAKFSSDTSSFRVGLRFDAPLNRKAERNTYRAQMIEYQRSRRRWIAGRDGVVQAIRLDLRELQAERLNFEIARQRLIVAARQVELTRLQLLAPNQAANATNTLNALDALDSLLAAKNGLIAVWVAYETNRLQLLLNTEALQLDERGLLADDDTDQPHGREPLPPPVPEPDSI